MTKIEEINALIQELPEPEKQFVSDGYHTFKELYDHRVKLFIALCNTLMAFQYEISDEIGPCWKSKLHSDGTMWEGWFIAGIGNTEGHTLTYHLPMIEWENLHSHKLEKAIEYDGHTSEDVLKLLSNF